MELWYSYVRPYLIVDIVNSFCKLGNGRVSACRYRQKHKHYRNFPPASILSCGPGNKISLKIYNFSQKLAILKVIFVLSS